MIEHRELVAAKRRIYNQGKTIAQWANEHNYPIRHVYLVLNGTLKGRYGKAHDIAASLGIKQPS